MLYHLDYAKIIKNKEKKLGAVRPVSAYDGRRREVKRAKRITSLIGRLIILAVLLYYVIRACYVASTAAYVVENITPGNTVAPVILQKEEQVTNNEAGPVAVLVSTTPTPTPTSKPVHTNGATNTKKYTRASILRHVRAYNGSRITENYLDTLFEKCGNDADAVSKVVAIALAETGMGRDTKKNTNFYGWYPNGNRNYDPSIKEMATAMCRAVSRGGYYQKIGSDKKVTSTYTGADGTSKWIERFNWSRSKMIVR